MEITAKQVTGILADLLKAAAKENKVDPKNIYLLFLLDETYGGFYCKYGNAMVDIGIAGIKVKILKPKIATFITSALLNHAINNGIDKSKVNILLRPVDGKAVELFLRNGGGVVKPLTVDEFLKIQQ